MHVCYALLVAATSLLIASDAALSTATDSLSAAEASPGTAQLTHAATNSKRLLRSYTTVGEEEEEEEDDDDDDEVDADDEERGRGLFLKFKLDKAEFNPDKAQKLYGRWAKADKNLDRVAARLNVDPNGAFNQKYANLYMGYKLHLEKIGKTF